jgi:hypothetical protein
MKLKPVHTTSYAEGFAMGLFTVRRTGEFDGISRQFESIVMPLSHLHLWSYLPHERVFPARLRHSKGRQPLVRQSSSVTQSCAADVRKELGAMTDAEHRLAGFQGLAYPGHFGAVEQRIIRMPLTIPKDDEANMPRFVERCSSIAVTPKGEVGTALSILEDR